MFNRGWCVSKVNRLKTVSNTTPHFAGLETILKLNEMKQYKNGSLNLVTRASRQYFFKCEYDRF